MEGEIITQVSQSSSFFVGWFTLSLITSGIAQSFDRTGFGWWILSLLIGPIALFILVLIGKNEET